MRFASMDNVCDVKRQGHTMKEVMKLQPLCGCLNPLGAHGDPRKYFFSPSVLT